MSGVKPNPKNRLGAMSNLNIGTSRKLSTSEKGGNAMKKKQYLILLDCCRSVVVKIKLTRSDIKKSKQYDDFEEFISEKLEEKYNFSLTNCSWMLTDSLDEITYNL